MSPEERFEAKKINEGTRSTAKFLNNLAVGTVVASFLSPLVSGHPTSAWGMSVCFLLPHATSIGRLTLDRLLQREDWHIFECFALPVTALLLELLRWIADHRRTHLPSSMASSPASW